MTGLAPILAAVETDSTAYKAGQIVGKLLLLAVGIVVAAYLVRGRRVPLRPQAVFLAIGGVLLALTAFGALLFVAGLTK